MPQRLFIKNLLKIILKNRIYTKQVSDYIYDLINNNLYIYQPDGNMEDFRIEKHSVEM